jgi:uncharacterized phage-associated protein
MLFNVFKTTNIYGIDEWYLFIEKSKSPTSPIVVSTNYDDIQKKIFEIIENSTNRHNVKEKVTCLSSNENVISLGNTKTTASDVANYFLYLANINNKDLTNKKLQKLIYYAQAWFLVLNDRNLFDDKIEAWVHGPAVRKLFFKFRNKFGFEPIKVKINQNIEKKFTDDEKEVIHEVWRVYGKCSDEYLEKLVHSELPYKKAREGLSLTEPSSREISTVLMKEYYTERLREVNRAKHEK